jgi:hypothetical protein
MDSLPLCRSQRRNTRYRLWSTRLSSHCQTHRHSVSFPFGSILASNDLVFFSLFISFSF